MSKILVKGVYDSAAPTMNSGNDVDLHLSAKGYVIAVNADGSAIGGTSYIEDTASTGGESLILSGAVRQDTLASSTSTDGDYANLKVDSTGKLYVNSQGGVAAGAADSGNPVKVGAKYNATLPTYTDGNRGDLQITAKGGLLTTLQTSTTVAVVDGVTNTTNVLNDSAGNNISVTSRNSIFNGTTWDRARSVVNAQDTTGTGIPASGILGQYDDVATGTVTENQFAPIRISSRRNILVEGSVASAVADDGNPIKVGGKYNFSAPTFIDGQRADLQTDVSGNLKVTNATLSAGEDLTNNIQGVVHKPVAASTYAPSLYTAITQVTKANIKNSAGNVFSIAITNTNAAVRYFQLHNKASAPAATEVPIYSFPVPAGSATVPGVLMVGVDFFTEAGYYFSTGIGWAISTTYGTFTDSATNTEHIPIIHYI